MGFAQTNFLFWLIFKCKYASRVILALSLPADAKENGTRVMCPPTCVAKHDIDQHTTGAVSYGKDNNDRRLTTRVICYIHACTVESFQKVSA